LFDFFRSEKQIEICIYIYIIFSIDKQLFENQQNVAQKRHEQGLLHDVSKLAIRLQPSRSTKVEQLPKANLHELHIAKYQAVQH
jgi:hypothetical protein